MRILGLTFDWSLIAGRTLEEEAPRPGERVLDDLSRHADPVRRDQLVLPGHDRAMTLEIRDDGERLALCVVDAGRREDAG